MTAKQCKVLKVIRNQPTEVPATWEIYNAPRPLYGSYSKTWQGDFICGIFYAGIDPADEYADNWRKENASLDAKQLIFVTREQAIAEALEYYKKFPKVLAEIDLEDSDHQGMLIDGWVDRQRKAL